MPAMRAPLSPSLAILAALAAVVFTTAGCSQSSYVPLPPGPEGGVTGDATTSDSGVEDAQVEGGATDASEATTDAEVDASHDAATDSAVDAPTDAALGDGGVLDGAVD
jgi:hypothetical protein